MSPIYPDDTSSYKTEWKGWADWLGTEFWPFEKARKYVHRLGLKNKEDWQDWCKSGKRAEYIPSTPDDTYKNKDGLIGMIGLILKKESGQ